MIHINWSPLPHLGPIPINWYGLTFLLAFLIGARLVMRWARRCGIPQKWVEGLLAWIFVGLLTGARLYFIVQNDLESYITEPWRILAVWEGGLAFFAGLLAQSLHRIYCRRFGLPFSTITDLFAPVIPFVSIYPTSRREKHIECVLLGGRFLIKKVATAFFGTARALAPVHDQSLLHRKILWQRSRGVLLCSVPILAALSHPLD